MPGVRQRLIQKLIHLYPLFSGCGTIANSKFVRILSGKNSNTTWAMLNNGMWLRVPLDDFNGRAIYYAGDVDRKITWICSRIVRSGDTVIDVGANLGLVTFTLAHLVGDNGSVFAFEPNPKLVNFLNQSIAHNGLQNTTIKQCAIGDKEGQLDLHIPLDHSGCGSVVRIQPSASIEKITVPVCTLSSAIPESVSSIRLLKIDVEGYEPQVLLGARDVFSRTPPDAVLFELNNVKSAPVDDPAIILLQEYGYVFLAIPKVFIRMRMLPFDPSQDFLPGHDLLACRKGKVMNEISNLLS